ncbi:hypothetical protein BP6252_13217 [Coleophoma cylindrospora]|uniref:Heterokaryon incompatibility domain-containing protein n=1 Tax=Coleophoma cylindrospora TaxID=1849047 RepID=A0A3D8QAE7_9HELO|nr:hypothetical protein BP6252_13217 [Coleophoma cylindrospora]
MEIDAQYHPDWPRRLLRVPTMESYEWKPGNVYGSVINPAYNILTYTWGRWALIDGQMPDVLHIGVQNVPWSLPRIDPSHFTTSSFQRVIESCTINLRQPSGWLINRSRQVEFLWVDVACIDQDFRSASIDEIGRQAKIFFEAEKTFVWFTRIDTNTLKRSTDYLERPILGLYKSGDFRRLEKRLQLIHDSLSKIFSDPWFSSLWTLQEAYLRRDAILLSREGLPVPHNNEKNRTLDRLIQRTAVIYNICSTILSHEGGNCAQVQQLSRNILRQVDSSGLVQLSTQNPLAVYSVSHSRKSSSYLDRIYGIQQIFEFRLGHSRPGSDPTEHITLVGLEEQLGESLLSKYPILSQLHVIVDEGLLGSAWRIGRNSKVPRLNLFGNGNWKWVSAEQPQAKLSTCRVEGNLWGQFEGPLCNFGSLLTAWVSVDSQPQFNSLINNISSVSIYLDNIEALHGSPEFQENPYEVISRDQQRQHTLSKWLHSRFINDRLCVLLLGNMTGPGRATPEESDPLDLKYYVGIILLHQESNGLTHWRRLGFCAWEVEHLADDEQDAPEKAFLEGQGDQWQTVIGIFG